MKHARAFWLTSLLVGALAPAAAAVVGTVESAAGRIDLFDEPGVCIGNAHRAEFVPPDGKTSIGGCWVADDELVAIVFFDTDIARIPVAAIRKPTKA